MQNFKNHSRYYPLHHFIVTPLTLVYFIWSIVNLVNDLSNEASLSHAGFNLLGAFIIVLLPILARIYALKNQDRLIRLEMRQRYFELTGKSFSEMERKLRLSQIVALRFAGNEELVPLMKKAIRENLKSNFIKQSINNWQIDKYRV